MLLEQLGNYVYGKIIILLVTVMGCGYYNILLWSVLHPMLSGSGFSSCDRNLSIKFNFYRWNNSCLLANPSARKFILTFSLLILQLRFEPIYKEFSQWVCHIRVRQVPLVYLFTMQNLFNFRYDCYVTLQRREETWISIQTVYGNLWA